MGIIFHAKAHGLSLSVGDNRQHQQRNDANLFHIFILLFISYAEVVPRALMIVNFGGRGGGWAGQHWLAFDSANQRVVRYCCCYSLQHAP